MTGEFSREQAPRNQPLAAVPRAGHLMLGLFITLRDIHQACLRPPRSTIAKNEESPERCWVRRFRRLAIRAARFNYYLRTRFARIAAFCCLAEVTSPVEWMRKLVGVGIEIASLTLKSFNSNGVAPPPYANWRLMEPSTGAYPNGCSCICCLPTCSSAFTFRYCA
jgi:hypothetical protein